jgi:membrane associated rhomboid family serine protease
MSGGPNSGIMPMFTLMNETNFTNPLAIFRLFSHVAGHASFEHLMGNMTFILLLGPIIEERYGSQRTLFMILITGLLTAIANIVLFNTGLLGASGIVFMLIILVSITNVKNGEIPVTFILVAILFIGKEVLAGFGQDNVSNFAHIFGGLCGSVFGFSRK